MKRHDPNPMFYREQTLANLRVLFGSTVEILTCAGISSCVIAFAYETRLNGKRLKIMQTFGDDVEKALKALHDMT
ncbi:hypothetical protein N7507_000354 [Penicillium longicatenatum]|nr:hypothetical protein N7507_000354 [Penicillium longicatenatum]